MVLSFCRLTNSHLFSLAPSLLFSRSVVSNSLWPHELQDAKLSYPSLSPWVCSESCPLSQRCHLTISSSVIPFSSCPQSFPASGSFPMSWLFSSSGQSIGASASAFVLPVNIQSWFPLGLNSLILLLSKGLSRVFSSTTESISSLVLSLLYGLTLISIHDYWQNHRFDSIDFCGQSDVSALLYAI